MKRREFMGASAAVALAPVAGYSEPEFRLAAEPVTAQILTDDEPPTQMLGFNGSTPGPELRFRQGDRVYVSFENRTERESAIHWHGIHIDNAMDGVPDLTQAIVEPGEVFDYQFDVPYAGTYWYHAHHRSWEQVARGLYGPLIVEELENPNIDHDITVVLDDWRLNSDGGLHDSFGDGHDFSHAGRLGNYAKALFSSDTVRLGDRVRLRLINAATARIFQMRISGGHGSVVAYDGMPVSEPTPLSDLTLAPAQRVDVVLDVDGPVSFNLLIQEDSYNLGTIAVRGVNPAPIKSPIRPLPLARVPVPDLNSGIHLALVMQGGAMGGRHGGDDFWAFNDRSGITDTPWQRFKQGETVRITLRNDTAFPHGIHLHGHHFHEIGEDGLPGHYRDTTLVDPRKSRDILCVFDNPGKWLLHCHTLAHPGIWNEDLG